MLLPPAALAAPLSLHDKFEQLIEGMLTNSYGVCDDFLTPELLASLRTRLHTLYAEQEMKAAGVGRATGFRESAEIRGDVIHWLEAKVDPAEDELLAQLQSFVEHLNRTCFAGINTQEFHFALYPAGSRYRRHLDQFKSDSGRLFSMVLYLNEEWQDADGGQLRVYPTDHPQGLDVYPQAGRAVFFRADELEHEVIPAPNRERMSIAGWFKK
ncbi:MAG: 2OG-Fe(II) oxygenase [Saprospiraceae bacterium]